VYHVFRSLFPFGAQKGPYVEERGIYDDYVLLAIQYSVLRSLLVGMAGHYKSDLSPNHVVQLMQSYVRDFEHSTPFLKRVQHSFADTGLDTLAALAMLVKDPQDSSPDRIGEDATILKISV
jgi:lysine-N-methylase